MPYASAKTFVLYGLMENYWESNDQTYDTVIDTVYEILNIVLTGYVEELKYEEVLTRLEKETTVEN